MSIEPWRGHWIALPDDACTRLGGARLGVSTVVGTRVWDCQHKFRIVIGPLSYTDYRRMLPGGDSMKRLLAWVRNYVGGALDWDVRLILDKGEIPPLRLGGGEAGARLGWSTWPMSGPATRDPDDLLINPSAYL